MGGRLRSERRRAIGRAALVMGRDDGAHWSAEGSLIGWGGGAALAGIWGLLRPAFADWVSLRMGRGQPDDRSLIRPLIRQWGAPSSAIGRAALVLGRDDGAHWSAEGSLIGWGGGRRSLIGRLGFGDC